jgi:hypothetical protein
MSARANAPVFQLHPSATALNSPTQAHVAPASHGFTPTNAAQLLPNAIPPPLPQHQQPPPPPPPPPPPGPTHSYHQRTDSNSSQGRRRNSSFSRRRTTDPRSRSSVPPQLGPTLPQIQPASEADLVSGPRTTPLETYSGVKREGESAGFVEPYFKRRREEEAGGFRSDRVAAADPERSSPGGRSPDRSSQRSGSGSVRSARSAKSVKSSKREEPEEPAQALNEPPPAAS